MAKKFIGHEMKLWNTKELVLGDALGKPSHTALAMYQRAAIYPQKYKDVYILYCVLTYFTRFYKRTLCSYSAV